MLFSQSNLTLESQPGHNGRGDPYVVLAVSAVPFINRGYFVVRATPLVDRLGLSPNPNMDPRHQPSHLLPSRDASTCEWKIEATLMQQHPVAASPDGSGGAVRAHNLPPDTHETLLAHLALESPFPCPTVEFVSCVTHDDPSHHQPTAPAHGSIRAGPGGSLPPLALGGAPHDDMEREVATIVVVFKHGDNGSDFMGAHGSPGCGPSQASFLLSRNVMAFSIYRFPDRSSGARSKLPARPAHSFAISLLADDVVTPWPDEILGSLKAAKKGPATLLQSRHVAPETELGASLNYHLNADASSLTIQVFAKGVDVEAVRMARKNAAKPSATAAGPSIGKRGMGLYETVGMSTMVLLRGDISPVRAAQGRNPSHDKQYHREVAAPIQGTQTATTNSCPIFIAAALFPDIIVTGLQSAGLPGGGARNGNSIIAGCVDSASDSILLLSGLQASCRREAGQTPFPTSHLTLRSFSQDSSRGAFFHLSGGGKTTCCSIDPTASFVAVGTSLGKVFLIHFSNSRTVNGAAGELTHMLMTSVSLPLHLMASVSRCAAIALYPTKSSPGSVNPNGKKVAASRRRLMLVAVSKSSKACLFSGVVEGSPDASNGAMSLGFYGELLGKLRACHFISPCSHNVLQVFSKTMPPAADPPPTPHNTPSKAPLLLRPESTARTAACLALAPLLEPICHCISLTEDVSPFASKQRSPDRTLCGSQSIVFALRERRKISISSVRTAYESDVGTFVGALTGTGTNSSKSSQDAYAKLAYVPLHFVGTPLQWRDPLMAAFTNPNLSTDAPDPNTHVREDVPWVTPICEIPVESNAPSAANEATQTFLSTNNGTDVNDSRRCLDDVDPYLHHLKPLGSGTFGAVTMAVSRAFPDRSFAVKRVRKMTSDNNEYDQNMVRTFFQEALNVLTSIPRHDNVVRYYGIYDSSKHHNIVMELARFGSLDEALFPPFNDLPLLVSKRAEGPTPSTASPKSTLHITERVLVNWLGQGLHGLYHLHTHGVVHRDVKAGNILLSDGMGGSNDRRLLWTDFGVSCVESSKSSGPNGGGHTSAKTAMRTVIGTMGFTAPELLEHWGTTESVRYSAVCDVWGLGVVFYCYITGLGWLNQGGCIGVATAPQEITDVCAGKLMPLMELKRAALASFPNDELEPTSYQSPAMSAIDGPSSTRSFPADIQHQRVLQLSDQLLSLIDSMMRVNREERITTAGALRHPLFCGSWLNTARMLPSVVPSLHFHIESWSVQPMHEVPALGECAREYPSRDAKVLLSEMVRSFNPPTIQPGTKSSGMLLWRVLIGCPSQVEATEAICKWMDCLVEARNLIKAHSVGATQLHPQLLLPQNVERALNECNLAQLPRHVQKEWKQFCKKAFEDDPTKHPSPTPDAFANVEVLLGCLGQCDPFPTAYSGFGELHPFLSNAHYAPLKESISEWKSLIANWYTHGKSSLYPAPSPAGPHKSKSNKSGGLKHLDEDGSSSDDTVAATDLLQECVVDALKALLATFRHALAASYALDEECAFLLGCEHAFYHGGLVAGNVSMACPPPRILEVSETPLAVLLGMAVKSLVVGPPSLTGILSRHLAASPRTSQLTHKSTPTNSAKAKGSSSYSNQRDNDLLDAAALLYDAGFHFGNRWSLASCVDALVSG